MMRPSLRFLGAFCALAALVLVAAGAAHAADGAALAGHVTAFGATLATAGLAVPESVAAELKSIKETVAKQFDDKIRDLDAKADKRWDELKKSPDAVLGDSLKTILDERVQTVEAKAEATQKALNDRMNEVETKARGGSGSGETYHERALKALESWGFDPKAAQTKSRMKLGVNDFFGKAVTTITNANANDAGYATVAPSLREYPTDPLTLRSLVAPGTIDGFYFKYERELAGSQEGDAGYQAEGAVKPSMDIYTELVTDEVSTVAVTSRVSQQVFDDRAAFISFLRARMGYRVLRKLDREILNGAGGAGELTGVNTVATAYDNGHVGIVVATQKLDVLRFARNQVELANYAPDGVALHPTDWAGIETLKDGDERYLIGDPRSGGSSGIGRVGSVWGMPVVTTAGQAADDFTVGDWMGGAQLFMRQELEVLASTEDQENFVRNLVTLRAELRALLAVYSALAFTTGDFTSALAAS